MTIFQKSKVFSSKDTLYPVQFSGFLKFQDSEEITNHELADAFEQMWQKQR